MGFIDTLRMLFVRMDTKANGVPRSTKWGAFRDAFIRGKRCAACGGTEKLEAHHIIPFSVDPSKELDAKNLIVLCEGNKQCNCHLVFGHGWNYADYNPYARKSAHYMAWLKKCTQKVKEVVE